MILHHHCALGISPGEKLLAMHGGRGEARSNHRIVHREMLAYCWLCPKKKLVLGVSQLLVLGRAEEKLIREYSRYLIPLLLVEHAPGFELGAKVLFWEGRVCSGTLVLLLV